MSIFLIDDPDTALYNEDLLFPFALDGNNDLKVLGGPDNLVAAMVFRAITRRGEIVHRPFYGVDFDEFQNGPALEEEYVILRARLLEQYQRENRLEAVTVEIVADSSGSGDISVNLHGTTRAGEVVTATVPLEGTL